MKLGRLKSPPDHRDKRLATFAPIITESPLGSNWTRLPDHSMIVFPEFGNLQYGDCTCAALGHGERAAALINGATPKVDLDLVYDAYESISSWRRDRPTVNDDGANNRDALVYFKKRGLIEAYLRINEANIPHIKFAIAHGGAYVGADLPVAAQKQLSDGKPWDVPKYGERWDATYTRRSWGGHAMYALAYDRNYVTFVTWGKLQKATWEWFVTYVDEAWFPIFDVWTQAGKLTASGFDIERLYREIGKIAIAVPGNPFGKS